MLASVAAATSLTNIDLDLGWYKLWASDVEVCSSLTGLARLKNLRYGLTMPRNKNTYNRPRVQLAPGDALALTTLTSLTRLELSGDLGISTSTVAALARNLRQLQELDLWRCQVEGLGTAEGMACLEAVGGLTQLIFLALSCDPGLTQQGLMQLTKLSRLEGLCIETLSSGCDEQAFWAAVRRG
jgi:hypothetical protein